MYVKATCPVHVLGPLVDGIPCGTRLFPNVTLAGALGASRTILAGLEVEKAECYRTHDSRKGHALGLQFFGKYWFVHDRKSLTYLDGGCTALRDTQGGRVEVARLLAVS